MTQYCVTLPAAVPILCDEALFCVLMVDFVRRIHEFKMIVINDLKDSAFCVFDFDYLLYLLLFSRSRGALCLL